MGKPGNLKAHLRTHSESKKWIENFERFQNKECVKQIGSKTILLAKYFITSSVAIENLKNKYLRALLSIKLGKNTFKNRILPLFMRQMHDKLESCLIKAEYIHLVPDFWSSPENSSFLGLGVVLAYEDFTTEIIIIGFKRTRGSNNAEKIKACIEYIVNTYNFNKDKVSAVVCDEGRNFLKLFKEIQNEDNENNEFEHKNDEPSEEIIEDDQERESYNVEDGDEDENNDEDDDEDEEEEEDKEFKIEDSVETILNKAEYLEIINEVNNLRSEHETFEEFEKVEIDMRDDDEYDTSLGSPIHKLDLVMGSSQIPRFSCAAHKINLVVRKSIKSIPSVDEFFICLSNHAKTIKQKSEFSDLHRCRKSKIHRANNTRWSSYYLMLLTYYKSYKKGVFNKEYNCPKTFEEITNYLKILTPFHIFSKCMQEEKGSISSIIPALLFLLNSKLRTMKLNDTNLSEFVVNLMAFTNIKFDYELNKSKVHKVAALLNVCTLDRWRNQRFGKPFYTKACENLYDVAYPMINKSDFERKKREKINLEQELETKSKDDINLSLLFENCLYEKSSEEQDDHDLLKNKLKLEIAEFFELISEIKLEKSFWRDYKKKLPILFKIALRLISIPASSAIIERFFSLSGLLCQKRRMNISDDVLIQRTMLKANIKYFSEL